MPRILESFRVAKAAITPALQSHGLEINSAGTKGDSLKEPLDSNSGYWSKPAAIAQRPLRWILHFSSESGALKARLAQDSTGELLTAAATLGVANNRRGTTAVFGCRILAAVRTNDSPSQYEFPVDWEWVILFVFPSPLPGGTSGQLMSSFDLAAGTVDYLGAKEFAHIALVPQKKPNPGDVVTGTGRLTYEAATEALKNFLSGGRAPVSVHAPDSLEDMRSLGALVDEALSGYLGGAPHEAAVPRELKKIESPPASFIGLPPTILAEINAALAIGKRHFIFYGPPGTGKTTLAEHVAAQLSDSEDPDGGYVLLTASAAWSGQDLIGGYQPLGDGKVGFIRGALIRNFHKPLIIDELNRCPIDKVIGPLFSVLSGQVSTLPYRTDITKQDSDFYSLLPKPKASPADHEFAPGHDWHLLCTLNTIDRTQLGQISYALSRRFAWIKIGVPPDLNDFVQEVLKREGAIEAKDESLPNPVADMWSAVNKVREIGGAPIIDFVRIARHILPTVNFLSRPVEATGEVFARTLAITVLPLLDGIDRRDAELLAAEVEVAWGLRPSSDLRRNILGLAL